MAESPKSPSRYSLPPEEKPKAKKPPTCKRKAPPRIAEPEITEAEPGKIKIDF